MRRLVSGGARDGLTAAVIAGLLRFPDVALRHSDGLARLAQRDRNLAPAIDSLLDAAEALERRGNSPISAADGLAASPDKHRFAFLLEATDPQVARAMLSEALALLVERPELDAALSAATARFAEDPEGSLAEQQRLRERKLDIQRRLGQMASERAAAAAETDSARLPELEPAGDQQTD